MTNEVEKAVKVIKEYLELDKDVEGNEYLDALRVMVKALETHEGDLIDQILDKLTEVYERHGFLHYEDYSYLFDFVDAIPSATPQPKEGRWIPIDYQRDRFKCSNCHTEGYVDTRMYKPIWKYCPICGAKMEEEDEDSD